MLGRIIIESLVLISFIKAQDMPVSVSVKDTLKNSQIMNHLSMVVKVFRILNQKQQIKVITEMRHFSFLGETSNTVHFNYI